MPAPIREFIGWWRENPSQVARGSIVLVVVAIVSALLTYFFSDLFGVGSAPRLAAELQQTRREFAEQAEARARLERTLRQSLVSEIKAVRVLRQPGWRWYALERIGQAAKLDTARRDPVELRNAALAILVEPDVLSLAALKGHQAPIRCVAFSPNGDHIVTGSMDGAIRVWDVLSGKQVHTLEVGSPVKSLSFDSHGLVLMAAADDGIARSWRTDEWDKPHELAGATDRATSLSVSPDNSAVAIALEGGSVLLRDVSSGEPVGELSSRSTVNCLAWSPDGRRLAGGASDNLVHIWDTQTRAELEPCVGHTAPITALAVRSDGSSIVSVSNDGTVREWDAHTSASLAVWPTSGGPALSVALRPDTPEVAIGSTDGGLRLLNLVTGEERLLVREHTGPVTGVAFSPDGNMLVSGSADSTARLYAVTVGSDRRRYRAHFADFADVQSLDFAPTGRWLASGSTDCSVALFPTQSDAPDRLHANGTILSAAYSPDGNQIVVGCKDRNTVVVWDVTSGAVRRVFWGHSGGVLAVSWSCDGRTIASGSEDGTVRFWDATDGSAGPVLRGHAGPVNSVAFSPDGSFLASGSFDRTVRVWPRSEADLPGVPMTIGEHSGYVLSVAWSHDGRMLASAAADHLIKLWELSDIDRGRLATNHSNSAPRRIRAREVGELVGHTSHVFSVAFSPDGTRLVSGSNDHTMRIWDVTRRQSLVSVPAHSAKLLAVAYDPRGELVASAAEDGSVRIWSLRGLRQTSNASRDRSRSAEAPAPALELFASLDHSLGVPALKFSPNGHDLLTGSWDRSIRLWSVRADNLNEKGISNSTPAPDPSSDLPTARTVRPRRVLAGRTARVPTDTRPAMPIRFANGVVLALKLSPDGKRLAVGCKEPSVVAIWELESRSIVRLLSGHTDDVMSVAWSPDGRMIASGSRDTTVRLWDAETGNQLAVLRGHTGIVNAVAFHPDGRLLASGSFDRTIRLWAVGGDAEQGGLARPITQLQAHAGWVLGLAFSGNGATLASASADSTVRVWGLTVAGLGASPELSEFAKLEGHVGLVYAVSLSPDGSLVASAGDDGTVRIWEVASGSCRHIAAGHAARVYSVSFSPDGMHVASGSFDHEVRLWDVESGEAVAVFSGHRAAVPALAFGPAGQLITGSWDRTIRVWDIHSGLTDAVLDRQSEPVNSVAFSPDAKRLVWASRAGATRLGDLDKLSCRQGIAARTAAEDISIGTGSRGLVRGSRLTVLINQESTGALIVRDADSGQQIATLAGADSPISSIAARPDSGLLATGHMDGTIQLYNWTVDDAGAANDRARPADFTITAHPGPVRSLAFAPSDSNAPELASSSGDAVVKIWTVRDRRQSGEVVSGSSLVSAIAYSNRGDLLAIGREDGIVQLWDTPQRQLLAELPAERRAVRAMAFSSNDRQLAIGGGGPLITLWNLDALRGQLSELGLDW